MHSAMRRRLGPLLLLTPALLLFGLLFLYPLAEILRISLFGREGFSTAGFERFWTSPVLRVVFWRTFRLAVEVTAICLLVGYPVAMFLTALSRGWRAAMVTLILLPLWTSVLVRSYTWMVLLGREGLVNTALQWLGLTDGPVRLMFTPFAVYLGMVQILLPLMVLTLYGVMADIDGGLSRAARILGASPWRAFLHVYLPLTVPGIVTGCVLVFILALGFFITPALLGGPRLRMLANLIDFEVHETLNWAQAAAIAVVLLAATLAAIGLFRVLVRERTLYGAAP